MRFTLKVMACAFLSVAANALAAAEPPLCTTHFFDWYVVSDQRPLGQWQRQWTYTIDWSALGIAPQEIGQSVHYYQVQFEKIRAAGFDGVHYEWHGNDPKPQFLEAATQVGLPLAMFYDMEIRFSGRPAFITPTDQFAQEAVGDVLQFYRSVPKALWLHDRHGKLPIVVYGYAFDQSVRDPQRWEAFYRALIDGVQNGLGERVVFHWTNTGTPQQMYGYQHFPEIQSYIFNEAGGQTQVGARSVTFVVHYDDLGVSFQREGPRGQRWIRNDIRYLEESLWLALHTDPDLVFNYGWNELFEGEHLLPDDHWSSWRCDVASAMVRTIKAQTRADLPAVLILVDDFLPALQADASEQAAMLRREMALLTRLRSFFPQAHVALAGSGRDLAPYSMVWALNLNKHAEEEQELAASQQRIVYANPLGTVDDSMLRQFTSSPLQPVAGPERGPANEYAVLTRPVEIDLQNLRRLAFRCRNTPGTLFHIRYYGQDDAGQEIAAWSENGPTDDCQTDGQWFEQQVDVAQLARQAVGRDLRRLTRIELILDDLGENGDFVLDLDYLRLMDDQGNIGWREEFDEAAGWTVGASFGGVPDAGKRYGFAAARDDDQSVGRLTLKARVADLPLGTFDEATRLIKPHEDAQVLHAAEFNGVRVPVVLKRNNVCFLNTYSPSEECWGAFLPSILEQPLHRNILFRSASHSVTKSGLATSTQQQLGVIPKMELPIDRVRLVAPPELNQALPVTLPASKSGWRLRIIRGSRATIPFPDPGSAPPTMTLQPGEIVELEKGP